MKKRRLYKMVSVLLAIFLLASCTPQGSGSVSSVIANSEGHKTESNVLTESATNGNNTSEISSAPSANASQTNQQTPSTSAQQLEDLSLEGKQRADNLMNELKNTDTDIIRFYSTYMTALGSIGFSSFSERAEKLQPHNVIDGAKQIEKFMTELKLNKWIPKKFNVKSMPKAVIYVSKDLHINLEVQHQGISWMSINSAKNANVYFVVPNDVYNSVMSFIEYDKTPADAIGYYTELTDEELKVADSQLKALKNAEINTLNIYDDSIIFSAGFRPFEKTKSIKDPTKTINNENEIKKFISELQIEKWTPKRHIAKSYSKALIYVSEDMHINLEGQQNGLSWMSINSEGYINIYYVVPNEVYQNVLAYFKEEKYICKATLDDNFSDDKVLFVINKELSKSDPEFTPDDFKNIEIAEIRRITSAIGDLTSPSATPEEAERKKKTLALTNLEEFRHIYAITLKNPSKENVLKAIKELEKIDYIVSAEPNYYFSLE